MMNERYILEHPDRGVLMGLDQVEPFVWKARWSWKAQRSEAEVFYSYPAALKALSRVPENQRRRVQVLRYGTWRKVRK